MVLACGTGPDRTVSSLLADRFDNAEWSTPVNLGPMVNSSAVDANAFLSPNEHELLFVSSRTGGFGLQDIWVTHRQCLSCDWEAAVHLGPPINTDAAEVSPTLSDDGKLLFFSSGRTGGLGGGDIYVSQRLSTDGDLWSDPVNLGPDVNSAGVEQGAYYVKLIGEENASLFFNRLGPTGTQDVYQVHVSNDGTPLGPAVLVPELSDPAGPEQKVAVRTDGQPSLSRDGRTLIFTSIRDGGLGLQDLWMSTRSPAGQ